MGSALPLRSSVSTALAMFAGLIPVTIARSAAQQPVADFGRIHGRVINPAGMPQTNGTVSLSLDGGTTLSYNFPVSPSGDYSGKSPPGEYTIIYRAPNTPEGKVVDYITGVDVLAGQDTAQDIDMTRQEFISRLSPEQQQQLQAMKEANAAAAVASKSDAMSIASDLEIIELDFKAAENARAMAAQNLGADAGRGDVDSMSAEIANAKFAEIQTIVTKDLSTDPDEPILLIDLARAEVGFKNYLDAETHYKKALDLATKADAPQPEVVGAAESGLGEVYAYTLLVDDANAAFEAAVKADPANAAVYLRNQIVVFLGAKNYPAAVDAADTAIRAHPNEAILYFLKAEGLTQSATVDSETNKLILPPGCREAFHKYLELDPSGAHVSEVNDILKRAGEGPQPDTATPQTDGTPQSGSAPKSDAGPRVTAPPQSQP
jgi:tetratricopeptide (TPR) repeat protein